MCLEYLSQQSVRRGVLPVSPWHWYMTFTTVLQKGENLAQLGRLGLSFNQAVWLWNPHCEPPRGSWARFLLWDRACPRIDFQPYLSSKWEPEVAHLPPVHLKCPHPVLGREHREWGLRIAKPWSPASSIEESGLTDPCSQPARWAPQALVPPAGETVCWPWSPEPCSPLLLEGQQVNTSFLCAGGLKTPRGHGTSMGTRFLEPSFGQRTF